MIIIYLELGNNLNNKRVQAERLFLNKMEGGCKMPIGVYTEIINNELLLIG